jgi:hypothetical protein
MRHLLRFDELVTEFGTSHTPLRTSARKNVPRTGSDSEQLRGSLYRNHRP